MTDNLIARLEAAEKGSRKLDEMVWEAVGSPERLYLRFFTTSIDAAMKLVPDHPGGNKAGFLHAAMYQTSMGDIPDHRIALAICVRALEARQEMNEGRS